jgi:hypothetical protein
MVVSFAIRVPHPALRAKRRGGAGQETPLRTGFYSNVRDSFDDLAFLDIPLHFAVVPGTLNFPRIADIRKMASSM